MSLPQVIYWTALRISLEARGWVTRRIALKEFHEIVLDPGILMQGTKEVFLVEMLDQVGPIFHDTSVKYWRSWGFTE